MRQLTLNESMNINGGLNPEIEAFLLTDAGAELSNMIFVVFFSAVVIGCLLGTALKND